MINKKNWQLTRKYLEYRLKVDQICEGSYRKEETHIRFILEWAADKSFIKSPSIRPTLPEYMLSARLDGSQGRLSSGYIKKFWQLHAVSLPGSLRTNQVIRVSNNHGLIRSK